VKFLLAQKENVTKKENAIKKENVTKKEPCGSFFSLVGQARACKY